MFQIFFILYFLPSLHHHSFHGNDFFHLSLVVLVLLVHDSKFSREHSGKKRTQCAIHNKGQNINYQRRIIVNMDYIPTLITCRFNHCWRGPHSIFTSALKDSRSIDMIVHCGPVCGSRSQRHSIVGDISSRE